MGKAFLGVMQLLMFLTYDFSWRGSKDEPSCDCVIEQLIYNKVTFVLTVLLHFWLWHVFCVCHLMIFGPVDDEIWYERRGARGRLYCTCAPVIIDWSDELMKRQQQQTSPLVVLWVVCWTEYWADNSNSSTCIRDVPTSKLGGSKTYLVYDFVVFRKLY